MIASAETIPAEGKMAPDWGTLEIALFLLVLYSSTLALVVGWCGWSVVKHGWRKGGLRRASYILFALFLVTRVCWCLGLMAEVLPPTHGLHYPHLPHAYTHAHTHHCSRPPFHMLPSTLAHPRIIIAALF